MRFRDAKKLHNKDEVVDKKTKDVGYVIGELEFYPRLENTPPLAIIQVIFKLGGYRRVTHLEID